MKFHPDVVAAHAQFGGDLESMQKLYDHPNVDVKQRLLTYIRQTRADLELMKSKTVQPSAAEAVEAICVDLEKISAGLSTAIGANRGGE